MAELTEVKTNIPEGVPVEPAGDQAVSPMPTAGFLDENPGEKSAMRIMCLLALVAAIILFFISAIGGLVGNQNTAQATQAALTLLGTAFSGKVAQKIVER